MLTLGLRELTLGLRVQTLGLREPNLGLRALTLELCEHSSKEANPRSKDFYVREVGGS